MAAIEPPEAKAEGSLHEAYTYQQLPHGDYFRFLTLQPGVGDEALECTLHTATPAASEFEAISYVWGTTVRDQEVICDGRTMLVTPNLAQVLRSVRLPNKPRQLWADSICIDQDNKEEKGHQVSLFGGIYRSAQRVLVYMGADDDNHGPAVRSLLEDVTGMLKETFKKIDKDWDSFPYPDKDDPLLRDLRWASFRALFTQKWFKRGWVVQEVVLSHQSLVIWGQSTFDWEYVIRTFIWLEKRALSIYYAKDFRAANMSYHYYNCLEDFATTFFTEGDWRAWCSPSILRTLDGATHLQLEDPRDRIYAFIELPQAPGYRFKLWPNYNESHSELYSEFATKYVEATKSTEILDYVHYGNGFDDTLDEIPSWVPRWDIAAVPLRQNFPLIRKLESLAEEYFEPRIEDDGSLNVRGVMFDTVRYVSDYHDWATPIPEAVRKMWNDIVASSAPFPYSADSDDHADRLEAFLDALTPDTFQGEFLQFRRDRAAFARIAGLDNSNNEDAENSTRDDANNYLRLIKEVIPMRRFILTERGYMGLAPAAVRKGDLCGIIFGCVSPCILRKKEGAQRHAFIGGTTLLGKKRRQTSWDVGVYCNLLGEKDSKDWVEWDVEEQDIYLC